MALLMLAVLLLVLLGFVLLVACVVLPHVHQPVEGKSSETSVVEDAAAYEMVGGG